MGIYYQIAAVTMLECSLGGNGLWCGIGAMSSIRVVAKVEIENHHTYENPFYRPIFNVRAFADFSLQHDDLLSSL